MQTETSNTKKILITVLIILILGYAVYFFVFRETETQVYFDEFGNPVEAQVVGQDLINILNELESVSLDTSILKSQAFINLSDYSVVLPVEVPGRTDPFSAF